jgi:hypothetical protein
MHRVSAGDFSGIQEACRVARIRRTAKAGGTETTEGKPMKNRSN